MAGGIDIRIGRTFLTCAVWWLLWPATIWVAFRSGHDRVQATGCCGGERGNFGPVCIRNLDPTEGLLMLESLITMVVDINETTSVRSAYK